MKKRILFLIFSVLFLNSCAATAVATGLLMTYELGCNEGEMKTCDSDDSVVKRVAKGLTWPVIEPIKSISDGIEDYQPKRKNRYMAYSNKSHKESVSRVTLRVIDREMATQTVNILGKNIQISVPKNVELKVIENDIEMIDAQSGYGLPIKFFTVSNPCNNQEEWKNKEYKDKYLKKISKDEYFYLKSYTYDGKELEDKIVKANNMEKICENN